MKKLIKTVLPRTLPVMAGYIVLGIGFGIVTVKSGYGFWWVFLMSLLIYAGSMQFVAVGLLTGGASLLTTALTTLMVNARHLFYGISMVERYRGAGRIKPYLALSLTDETYSLVCTDSCPEGVEPKRYYTAVSLIDHFYWVTGSVLGALAGSAIRFNTEGIDFAMTALFITVFVEQWKTSKDHVPALIGLGVSVVCLLIFGSDSFLIPAMCAILALLTLDRKNIERRAEE